jgi:GT2 family glycosyltransferase/glycosyltransferase involved in cell wall biosynthesis/SAM-dependent methyltransferase
VHPLINESFDRFARYQHVESVRTVLGAAPIDILDVGDPYGTLDRLFPDDRTVSADVYAEELPSRDRHAHVLASGFELPFPDDSFDLVTCHDTLEHVPLERKTEFIAELLRVSRGPVLVVAPFADPRTSRCEEMANAYYVARLGYEMYQLTEHAASGLPDLGEVLAWADAEGVAYQLRSDGWLYHWLAFMILKIHLLSEADHDTHRRVDAAFNLLLRDADRRRPHYRRAIVLRPPAGLEEQPAEEVGEDDVDGDLRRLAALASELSIALPRGTDAMDGDSPLRAWVADRRDGDGPLAVAARDLETVLDAITGIELPPEPDAADTTGEQDDSTLPSVGVVLVNLNGADHLVDCLDSLAAQDYPADRLQVVLVDNDSTDGSRELLAERYPWVTVLPQDSNTGFAPAVNTGARALTTDCVVLVNNDARVDPSFVRELVAGFDPASGAVCVAARILSWDGTTVDFVDGAVNYYGMGQQLSYGQPVADVPVEDGAELLFACGGAMLVHRQVFLDLGGLDPGFFAYFEDVDFGWRLWVTGYRVVLAPKAVAYHRMHGTSGRFPLHQRYTLYERNALRMIVKNYSDENLQRVLGPALLLTAKRAVLRGNLERTAYDIAGDARTEETVPRLALAHLHAIGDLVDGLDTLMLTRSQIQRARKRPDHEILARFKRPMWPVMDDSAYLKASEAVSRAFGIDELFAQPQGSHALVVCNDGVGKRMSGPAIRAVEIAKHLAATARVTLAVPSAPEVEVPGVTVATFQDEADLRRLSDSADVVLFQGYTLKEFPSLADTTAVLVADLYDPWLFENIELHTGEIEGDSILRGDTAVLNQIVDECDFFVCASERQRDYWLGMLSARHRLTQAQYATDPSLRHLIDVVPFGLPDRDPERRARVLKGVHPGIAADDKVVLWGGGAWDWFDPLTLVEAWPAVVEQVPDARLWFLGLHLTTDNVKHMRVAHRATVRSDELGLTGTSVFFGDWVPYELREAYLLEADLGVTVARDLAETRLSFRTRVLDYLWAGLPVVTTEGDVLSDLVRNERLGAVVPPGDPQALTRALVHLLQHPVERSGMGQRARAVSHRFRWSVAVEPLRRVLREPWRWAESRAYRPRAGRVTEELRTVFEDVTHKRGQIVSGPRAAVAADRAAWQASLDRTEQVVRDHPYLVKALYHAQRTRGLGVRGTAGYLTRRVARRLRRGRTT